MIRNISTLKYIFIGYYGLTERYCNNAYCKKRKSYNIYLLILIQSFYVHFLRFIQCPKITVIVMTITIIKIIFNYFYKYKNKIGTTFKNVLFIL